MNYFSRLLLLLAAWSSLLPTAQAQAPAFDRAIACASGQGNYGWGPEQVVVDGQGNSYVTGTFNGTVLLGNTLLTATVASPVSTMPSDVFVAKLDVAGNYLWAVQMADNQSVGIGGLAVDMVGNVYLTGGFDSFRVSFGTNGPVLFNSSANSEAFVAKLDGRTGQWLWARRAGGVGNDYAGSVAINAVGDAYIVGDSQSGTAGFGAFTLASPGAFIAKISSAGVWRWARLVGTGQVGVSQVLCDSGGDLFLAGAFRGPSAAFGATTLTTNGIPGSPYAARGGDLFVGRMTDAGAWVWAVQGDALTHQNLIHGASLAADGAGHLYVTGAYESTAARIGTTVLPNASVLYPPPVGPPGPPPFTNHYFSDAFVARLDAATGAWDWAVRNGGPYAEGGTTPVADPQGRVYLLGSFDNATIAGEGVKLAQLDGATGAWRTAQMLAPLGIWHLALDGQSRLHLAGFFDGATATFGPLTLTSAGAGRTTGFLARLHAGPLATAAPTRPGPVLTVWPNPSGRGPVWVQGPQPGQPVEVFDALGRRVTQGKMPSNGPLELQLPALLPPGVYVVRGGGQAQRLQVE